MAHAERCPVCEGSGRAKIGVIRGEDLTTICRGCDGRGWVTVRGVQDGPPVSVWLPHLSYIGSTCPTCGQKWSPLPCGEGWATNAGKDLRPSKEEA